MNGIPSLKTALLDLLYEVRDRDIPLIIGGGFGIYQTNINSDFYAYRNMNTPVLIFS